jgi:tetrahydromethanopterin S-methyltransferase subunit F
MRDPSDTTLKQKAGIAAGALAALVIVGWLAVIAVALMSGG